MSIFLLTFAPVTGNTLLSLPKKSPEEVQALGLTGVVSTNSREVLILLKNGLVYKLE